MCVSPGSMTRRKGVWLRETRCVPRLSCAPGEEGLVHVVFACAHKLEENRGDVSTHPEPTLFRISSR